MASPARAAFLGGFRAFQTALDEPSVRAANDTGQFLRRGLTVAAYNLLETFVIDRTSEIAAHINAGETQFLDLPERLQRRAITNTIAVANSQLRFDRRELSELRTYSLTLGGSLSTVGHALDLSPLTWLWPGSNMAAWDLRDALRFLHVDQPWQNLRRIAGRMSFVIDDFNGDALNFEAELAALAQERHRCAHVASYGVTTVWLRAVPEQILRYAVGFDALGSASAELLRRGDPHMLANRRWMHDGRVQLRFVRERGVDYAEYVEGRARAHRTGPDRSALLAAAAGRCGQGEILVEQARTKDVVSWSIPSIDQI